MGKIAWRLAVAGIVGVVVTTTGAAITLKAAPQDVATAQAKRKAFKGGVKSGAGQGFGRFGLTGRVVNRLGLTDAQTQQIKGIAQSHRDEWKALGGRLSTARTALREATAASPTDEGAIRQRSTEVAAVEADIAVARAHARAEMFQVLTPDQQAQLQTLGDRARAGLKARRQKRLNQAR